LKSNGKLASIFRIMPRGPPGPAHPVVIFKQSLDHFAQNFHLSYATAGSFPEFLAALRRWLRLPSSPYRSLALADVLEHLDTADVGRLQRRLKMTGAGGFSPAGLQGMAGTSTYEQSLTLIVAEQVQAVVGVGDFEHSASCDTLLFAALCQANPDGGQHLFTQAQAFAAASISFPSLREQIKASMSKFPVGVEIDPVDLVPPIDQSLQKLFSIGLTPPQVSMGNTVLLLNPPQFPITAKEGSIK
jgi:hypothetical protein